MVWVSCAPEDPSDQAHLGAIEYSPWRGFPKYYFPIRNEAPYLAPIVAVQFLKPASKAFFGDLCFCLRCERSFREGGLWLNIS